MTSATRLDFLNGVVKASGVLLLSGCASAIPGGVLNGLNSPTEFGSRRAMSTNSSTITTDSGQVLTYVDTGMGGWQLTDSNNQWVYQCTTSDAIIYSFFSRQAGFLGSVDYNTLTVGNTVTLANGSSISIPTSDLVTASDGSSTSLQNNGTSTADYLYTNRFQQTYDGYLGMRNTTATGSGGGGHYVPLLRVNHPHGHGGTVTPAVSISCAWAIADFGLAAAATVLCLLGTVTLVGAIGFFVGLGASSSAAAHMALECKN